MSSDPPPDSPAMNLDFSQFHPIDHLVGTSRCRKFYGGPKQHFKLEWEFFWFPKLKGITLCPLNKHQFNDVTQYKDGKPHHVFKSCLNCRKRKE